MWEAVPGVIRDNGIDTFRLEVNVNGAVSQVHLSVWTPIVTQSGQTNIFLRDDGLQGDRKVNDFIYTSEPLRFDTGQPLHTLYYASDTNSPAGVAIEDVGQVTITETDVSNPDFFMARKSGFCIRPFRSSTGCRCLRTWSFHHISSTCVERIFRPKSLCGGSHSVQPTFLRGFIP